jgi:hypothetical protein
MFLAYLNVGMYSRNTDIAWVTERDSKTNGKNKGKAIIVTAREGT